MQYTSHFTAGLPQLDIHTLSEDWALATALENHWIILAQSMGLKPSDWIDSQGDRMYGAVMYLSTDFDLEDTLKEDDAFAAETEFLSIRKPHALSVVSRMWWKFSGGDLRALGFGPDQATRSRVIGSMG